MVNTSSYQSPFRPYDHEHESDDPLCLSRKHHDEPALGTWDECYEAALALCDTEAPQFALWAVRHLVELGLKLLIGPSARGHSLQELLDQAPQLSLANPRMRNFILDLDRLDPKGDACRYGFTASGAVALGDWCCVERSELRQLATEFHRSIETLRSAQ